MVKYFFFAFSSNQFNLLCVSSNVNFHLMDFAEQDDVGCRYTGIIGIDYISSDQCVRIDSFEHGYAG